MLQVFDSGTKMSKKDKLSKEVEEQIQSLASDVYIQIEEKLTQLMCATPPEEPTQKIIIEQDPAYIALQNNYQMSQNELSEKNKSFSGKINQLEQENSQTKEQLEEALVKQQASEQNFQVELTQHNINFTETIERLEHENRLIKASLAQALSNEQKKLKLELNEQLQQAQKEAEAQEKRLTEQQEKLTFLEETIKQQVKTVQDYKQEVNQLNDQQVRLQQQQLQEQKDNSVKEQESQKEQETLLQQVSQLEKNNQELVSNLITEQSDIKLYQKEVESLKSQVKLAQDGQENILNRFNANREKQEKDNDQVRETIKYLRDENSEMITQHNEKKEQFLEQIHELESKLTEYRLKFEYAQKQLTKNN